MVAISLKHNIVFKKYLLERASSSFAGLQLWYALDLGGNMNYRLLTDYRLLTFSTII